jgi:putative ABC transport system substrate-binding protein
VAGDIPIVFIAVSDPVKSGIVASLARPGGNITGVSNFLPATSGKLLELLVLVAPTAARFGVLHNPNNEGKILELQELQSAGRTLAVQIEPIEVRSLNDFQNAFSRTSNLKCDALIVLQEGVTLGGRQQIAKYAENNKLPAIYQIREFVEAGGLLSYGLNYCRHYGRAATYVDKILKGERPADLPVELPTRFELVVNLKTAKAIALEIPAMLLARADEVIE